MTSPTGVQNFRGITSGIVSFRASGYVHRYGEFSGLPPGALVPFFSP